MTAAQPDDPERSRLAKGPAEALSDRRAVAGLPAATEVSAATSGDPLGSEGPRRQAETMEAIGRLSGGLAHDFNNLLTVIGGNLELLDRHVTTPSGRRLLETAGRAAHRAAELTGKLLAFSRNQHLLPRAVDLNHLVARAREAIQHLVGASVEIEMALAPDLHRAMVDPVQLERAILDLAANARDAMPAGGRVTIGTRNALLPENGAPLDLSPGGYVAVHVADTGIGIEPRLLDRVIEPFFTTKRPGTGSGLGLSMVYGTVKQSGGGLSIVSRHGRGTRVELFLPRA